MMPGVRFGQRVNGLKDGGCRIGNRMITEQNQDSGIWAGVIMHACVRCASGGKSLQAGHGRRRRWAAARGHLVCSDNACFHDQTQPAYTKLFNR